MCDVDSVESIANKLGGVARPNSVDAEAAKALLLNYGEALAELQEEMVWLAEWMCNTSPPWAAYRGLMMRQMVALDKEPGTRPVGIGCICL